MSASPHRAHGCVLDILDSDVRAPRSRNDTDGQLRTAAYEVLNSFVTNAAGHSLPMVANLSEVILQRLESTLAMQNQIVSVEDRLTLEEIQTSLTSVLLVSRVPCLGR